MPRTLLGILVGAALGVAGAILQGVTRNPLADAGIMGINSGAAAFVVFAITVLGVRGVGVYVWFAFAGRDRGDRCWSTRSRRWAGKAPPRSSWRWPARPSPPASARSPPASCMTNVDALNELRFWQVGSLAGRYAPILVGVAPFLIVGLVASLALRPGAQRPRAGRGHRPRAGPAGRPHPGGRVRRRRGARRRGHRRLRADRVRRARRAARRPVHLRPRLPLDPAVLDAAGADRAAARRRARPGASPRPASCRSAWSSACSGAPVFVAIVRYARLSEV